MTVVTLTQTALIVFTPGEFFALREDVPAVAAQIDRVAAERRAALALAEAPAPAEGSGASWSGAGTSVPAPVPLPPTRISA